MGARAPTLAPRNHQARWRRQKRCRTSEPGSGTTRWRRSPQAPQARSRRACASFCRTPGGRQQTGSTSRSTTNASRSPTTGHGVRNPAALLEYGTAVWTPRVLTEDPAGIGLFSLANEHVRIATRPAPTDTGEHHDAWSVDLTPAHFRGKPATPGTADNAPKPHGTTVSFCPDHIQDRWIDEQVMHFPVPVRVNGRKVARQPIAADADATIDWKGLRIGLFDGRNGVEKRSKLNCHGAVVSLHLRTIEGAPYAMVELVDCPQLRLERPGLGAVTDDQFTHELHEKVADLLSERKSAEERP